MRRFALSSLLALALVFGVVIAVPSVRAQVREMINTWYHFQFPDRQSSVGVGWGKDSEAFPPYLSMGTEFETRWMSKREINEIKEAWRAESLDGGKRLVS